MRENPQKILVLIKISNNLKYTGATRRIDSLLILRDLKAETLKYQDTRGKIKSVLNRNIKGYKAKFLVG